MSMLFISHDLGAGRRGRRQRGRDAPRRGARGRPASARSSARRSDAYTRALLACRPRLDTRPRAPAGDRRHREQPAARAPSSACRAPADGPALIEVTGLSKSLPAEGGPVPAQGDRCREGRRLHAAQGPHAGRGRRVGLGQDDDGHDAHAPAPMPTQRRRIMFEGIDLRDAAPAQRAAVPRAHPDHLPEPLRQPEPALHRRPDPDRADAHPRHRRERRRARAAGARLARARSACRRRPSASTRTSSPAASASASPSRAA